MCCSFSYLCYHKVMKNFYIFLDIDGVIYDWDFIIAETNAGRIKRGEFIKKFKPESIRALNYLIKGLEEHYDVRLVPFNYFYCYGVY